MPLFLRGIFLALNLKTPGKKMHDHPRSPFKYHLKLPLIIDVTLEVLGRHMV